MHFYFVLHYALLIDAIGGENKARTCVYMCANCSLG